MQRSASLAVLLATWVVRPQLHRHPSPPTALRLNRPRRGRCRHPARRHPSQHLCLWGSRRQLRECSSHRPLLHAAPRPLHRQPGQQAACPAGGMAPPFRRDPQHQPRLSLRQLRRRPRLLSSSQQRRPPTEPSSGRRPCPLCSSRGGTCRPLPPLQPPPPAVGMTCWGR